MIKLSVRALDGRTPLRVKLITAGLVLATLGRTVAGVAAVVFLREYLLRQVDVQLLHSVEGVARADPGPPVAAGTGPEDERRRGPEGDRERPALTVAFYSQVFAADGTPLGPGRLTAPGDAGRSPPTLPRLDPATVARLDGQPFTASADGAGSAWRVLVRAVPRGRTVVVALSLDQVEDTTTDVTVAEVVVGLLVLGALAGLGYLAISSSLRPLMRVEATAEAIAAGDLGRRVPSGHPATEVGRLAAALNVMLEQIEAAFRGREASEASARASEASARASEASARASEASARASEARMRRFVADASHELRTPLTSIRGFAELLRRQAALDPDAVPATTERIEAAATRMTALVEDLLLLARLDQQRPLHRGPVDLLALAADAVADFRVTTPGHPVTLRAPGGSDATPAVVEGDEIRLRQVVANLLTNAGTHTPAGTTVTVTVETAGGEAVLGVADAGPGLTPEVAERVFERFYRADTSRTRASGGTGLGLSIVEALVAAHGGSVRVASAPGTGTRFEVRLPLRSPEAG